MFEDQVNGIRRTFFIYAPFPSYSILLIYGTNSSTVSLLIP